MQRMGLVIGLKPEVIAEYKRIHAQVWPEILALISRCNIRNYTIFLREPENLLFASWEYHGSDFSADMALMRADPRMQDWWRITDPMQTPLARARRVNGGRRWKRSSITIEKAGPTRRAGLFALRHQTIFEIIGAALGVTGMERHLAADTCIFASAAGDRDDRIARIEEGTFDGDLAIGKRQRPEAFP